MPAARLIRCRGADKWPPSLRPGDATIQQTYLNRSSSERQRNSRILDNSCTTQAVNKRRAKRTVAYLTELAGPLRMG